MTLFMFWCLSGHLPLARSSTVSMDHAADRRRQVLTDFYGGDPLASAWWFQQLPSGYLTVRMENHNF